MPNSGLPASRPRIASEARNMTWLFSAAWSPGSAALSWAFFSAAVRTGANGAGAVWAVAAVAKAASANGAINRYKWRSPTEFDRAALAFRRRGASDVRVLEWQHASARLYAASDGRYSDRNPGSARHAARGLPRTRLARPRDRARFRPRPCEDARARRAVRRADRRSPPPPPPGRRRADRTERQGRRQRCRRLGDGRTRPRGPADRQRAPYRDRSRDRARAQHPAPGPLCLGRIALHPVRGRGLPPHHLFPRPARRAVEVQGEDARRQGALPGAAGERRSGSEGRARGRAALGRG